MSSFPHGLTSGHVARHVPQQSSVGRPEALLDIAQDFLLTHLHREGLFDDIVTFKGGTALRKLYAANEGRFSTDLDLAVASWDVARGAAADLVADEVDGLTAGPFNFTTETHRGRWRILTSSDLQRRGSLLPMKLDVGPPCWLRPEIRTFEPTPIQEQYGFELPGLPVMALEENLAEKVARLNRMSAARDAWDMVWVATTSPHSRFDRELLRRLAVLKNWVDNFGLNKHWQPAIGAREFDIERWLSSRDDWDDQAIGLLTHPPPTLQELEENLAKYYSGLADMTPEERQWGRADAGDRTEVVKAIASLPRGVLEEDYLWIT